MTTATANRHGTRHATHQSAPARFDRANQRQRAMFAKINIARQQLGLHEDDYRQMLFEATGQTSLKACSDRQLESMLKLLEAKGFRAVAKGGGPAQARHPMARKARALWISLHQLGVVHNPSEHALEAFAARQLKCEKLVWARQSDAYRLIEALKSMAMRAGWLMHDPLTMKPLSALGQQSALVGRIHALLKEEGAIPADWWLDRTAAKLCGIDTALTAAGYTPADYERLADALGAKLREHRARTGRPVASGSARDAGEPA